MVRIAVFTPYARKPPDVEARTGYGTDGSDRRDAPERDGRCLRGVSGDVEAVLAQEVGHPVGVVAPHLDGAVVDGAAGADLALEVRGQFLQVAPVGYRGRTPGSRSSACRTGATPRGR